MEALSRESQQVELIYVGTAGGAVQDALAGLPVRDLGVLPPDEVSQFFAALDLYLAPYPDGISTRRGTAIAGLAHGVPLVSTSGVLTDQVFLVANGNALIITDADEPREFAEAAQRLYADENMRARLGEVGRVLYKREFDWPVVARQMVIALKGTHVSNSI
jgi:glycosyltransferase involved in cell wall biosynthesis